MQTIYLDISNKGVIPCIQAKQSEVGRKFLAVITDNGVPYNVPSNSLLSVWYEGDTDAGNYSSIEEKSAFSIDGNKVTVELVAQMLLKPGKGELCLSVTHGDGGETNTWNIPYEVEYKPGAGSAVPTEYYTALTDAAARAAEQVGLAAEQAQAAKQYAEDAQEATGVLVESVDYVVDQGTKNGWFYRRWSSGTAECWYKKTLNVKIDNAWGSFYAGTSPTGRTQYPFTFVEIPYETVTFKSDLPTVFMVCSSNGSGNNTVSETASYNVVRYNKQEEASNFYFDYYVVGKLK